jgi:hypothetical protein
MGGYVTKGELGTSEDLKGVDQKREKQARANDSARA